MRPRRHGECRCGWALAAVLLAASLCLGGALNDSATADGITYTISQQDGGGEAEVKSSADFLEGLDSVSLNGLLAWSIGEMECCADLCNFALCDVRGELASWNSQSQKRRNEDVS